MGDIVFYNKIVMEVLLIQFLVNMSQIKVVKVKKLLDALELMEEKMCFLFAMNLYKFYIDSDSNLFFMFYMLKDY